MSEHSQLVSKYRSLEQAFRKSYSRTTEEVRNNIPMPKFVKYARNITARSVEILQKAYDELKYEQKFERNKKRRERARISRTTVRAFSIPTTNGVANIPAQTIPTANIPRGVDIEWDNIRNMLVDVMDGAMSSSMPFYNNQGGKFGGSGRRTSEHNASRILDLLDEGLNIRVSVNGMTETEAKRDIINKIEAVFGNNIAYELERLAYGVYDREYSRWGKRQWLSTYDKVKRACLDLR